LKAYIQGHLDVEFGPLLLSDNLIMDSTEFDHLTRSPPPGLVHASQSLLELASHGYIELRDYGSLLNSRAAAIKNATEVKLGATEHFLKEIRHSVNTWDAIAPNFSIPIGRADDPIANLPVGIIHALSADGKAINNANAIEIRKVLFSKKRFSTHERELLAEIARPYFDHAHSCLALTNALNSPIFDWADLRPVYDAILFANIHDAKPLEQQIPKARELFSVSLPNWEPSNVQEFLAALKNSHVRDFRQFIQDASEQQTGFDSALLNQLLGDLAKSKHIAGKVSTTGNVIATLFGVATSFFDGGITASVLTSGGTLAGQEVANKGIEKYLYRDSGWFLCLAQAKQGTKGK